MNNENLCESNVSVPNSSYGHNIVKIRAKSQKKAFFHKCRIYGRLGHTAMLNIMPHNVIASVATEDLL